MSVDGKIDVDPKRTGKVTDIDKKIAKTIDNMAVICYKWCKVV